MTDKEQQNKEIATHCQDTINRLESEISNLSTLSDLVKVSSSEWHLLCASICMLIEVQGSLMNVSRILTEYREPPKSEEK